ncbi:MAG: type III pantothenate kinase [Acidiferrobacterales bacterium]|nr:type III pantothenate kinase [Acidiferrobacterales bacterium]
MKLLFDIGNTRIKWGHWFSNEIHSTANLLACEASLSALDEAFETTTKPDSIWISNVGSKQVLAIVTQWCEVAYGLQPKLLGVSSSYLDIDNKYQSQDTLGVDRWVAAFGARAVVASGDLVIIDAGTAVTIDLLSHENCFEGGVILPGTELMHDVLINNTAGIRSNYSEPLKIIGRTTEECVNSGVSYGLVGAIERIVLEISQNLTEPPTIVLTGGDAPMIKKMSKLDMKFQPNLVLLGIASMAKGLLK